MTPKHSSLSMENVFDFLKKASLSKTKSRTALLKLLMEKHGPFSVDELHHLLKRHRVDRVTLYRCLTAFEEVGLVRRCDFGDGVARYEWQSSETHHHHVICKKCRMAVHFDECELIRLEEVVRKMGYTQVSHNLEFFGICPSCSK